MPSACSTLAPRIKSQKEWARAPELSCLPHSVPVGGLLLAARQTKCENLLLLTDHESEDIEQDGHRMKVQPVYEWCIELGNSSFAFAQLLCS